MSKFIKHTSCPKCGSSDGRALYTGGTSYCFACETYFNSNKEEVEMDNQVEKNKKFLEVVEINKRIRGISPKTFSFYNYYKDYQGNHLIKHYDKDGNYIAQKLRYPDKTFRWIGDAKKAVPFGYHLWRNGGKIITITEGELDCLSVAEAFECKYPVISVNNGAQSAYKDLKQYTDFINSYDKIYLWFDNDKPGQEAVKKLVTLFTPGKVYIVKHSKYKDANEILQKEGKAGIVRTFYEAKKYRPDGIINAKDISFNDLITDDDLQTYKTPYTKLNEKLAGGLEKGRLLVVTAGSGIGKSTLVREIAYYYGYKLNLKIGFVALEENNKRSALGFLGIYLNTPLHIRQHLLEMKETNEKLLKDAYDALFTNGNFYLYDHFGSLDSSNLLEKLRFLAVSEEVDFIVLDHISIVVSGEDTDNERKAIDMLMTNLRSLAEETGVGIIVISHLKRPTNTNKGFEDGLQITLSHLRGSGAIAQLADYVIALERNQQDEENKNIANIRVLKNRVTGETGLCCQVEYNPVTGRLLELNEEFVEEEIFDVEEDNDLY